MVSENDSVSSIGQLMMVKVSNHLTVNQFGVQNS